MPWKEEFYIQKKRALFITPDPQSQCQGPINFTLKLIVYNQPWPLNHALYTVVIKKKQ